MPTRSETEKSMEQELISSVRYIGAVPMFVIALILALRNRGRICSYVYNRSRYLLVAATLLLGIHFMIQYIGHLREQSVTLCWAVNMVFYVIVTPLYNMAELNLLRAGHNMASKYFGNALFVGTCYLIMAIGYFTGTLFNDSQPYMTATFWVAILYSVKLIELSWVLGKEMKVADSRLTDDELTERHNALRYTAKVMNLIILLSLATPWVGMSASLLLNAMFGTVILILIIVFLIRFLNYGENMPEFIAVNDELMEAAILEDENQDGNHHRQNSSDAEDDIVQQRIARWVSERHYTNPNITIGEALKDMAVSATALNFYLERNTSVENYRKWLPYLRIEEAKRIMLLHPEYSLQSIAEACGYANGGNLSRAFKMHEGMPPSEWIALHVNANTGKDKSAL